jgi:poly-gamma-glutamate synthesis protein (capsule biosynthesis protein)
VNRAGKAKSTQWLARAALAFLILASGGCGSRANSQEGTDPAEPGPVLVSTPASSITLALLGDVMLGRDVHPDAETFAYLEPFLTSADLALANLESPLTTSPVQTESPYALCAPPENVRYLVDAGFDLLALANNHHLDCGPTGLIETQSTLTDAGLGFIGPDPEPVYRSISRIRLAFLAFDAISEFDIEAAARAVQAARESGALVVVSIHWGMEYQSGASTSQKRIAQALAEAGATLIWGHHPHVLQPAEWINDGKTLVFYSLGNALFDQYGLESTRRSALVVVTLDSEGTKEFNVIPFLMDYRNSRVRKAGQADAQRILQYFKP